jgi:plasmid stabilization system protein ParE
MKYKVIFHAQAILDIETSFEWGVRTWGKKQAEKWARQFYKTCKKRLSQFPEACPIAPESKELDVTIRQLVIDRYCTLFVVEGDTVEILYVRGAYSSAMFDDVDEED